MTDTNMPLIELLQKHDEGDFLRAVTEAVLQTLMEHDVEGHLHHVGVHVAEPRPHRLDRLQRAIPRRDEVRFWIDRHLVVAPEGLAGPGDG